MDSSTVSSVNSANSNKLPAAAADGNSSGGGGGRSSGAMGTATPAPSLASVSRTQQKILLQKDQLETQETAKGLPASGSAAVKFAKEIERINREYACVARFHNPLQAARMRLQVQQQQAQQRQHFQDARNDQF